MTVKKTTTFTRASSFCCDIKDCRSKFAANRVNGDHIKFINGVRLQKIDSMRKGGDIADVKEIVSVPSFVANNEIVDVIVVDVVSPENAN